MSALPGDIPLPGQTERRWDSLRQSRFPRPLSAGVTPRCAGAARAPGGSGDLLGSSASAAEFRSPSWGLCLIPRSRDHWADCEHSAFARRKHSANSLDLLREQHANVNYGKATRDVFNENFLWMCWLPSQYWITHLCWLLRKIWYFDIVSSLDIKGWHPSSNVWSTSCIIYSINLTTFSVPLTE